MAEQNADYAATLYRKTLEAVSAALDVPLPKTHADHDTYLKVTERRVEAVLHTICGVLKAPPGNLAWEVDFLLANMADQIDTYGKVDYDVF